MANASSVRAPRHGASPAERSRAFADLPRIFEYAAEADPIRARRTIQGSRNAILILEDHPLIVRPAEARGELVMGPRSEAYVALNRWLPADDTALILAIRHSLNPRSIEM